MDTDEIREIIGGMVRKVRQPQPQNAGMDAARFPKINRVEVNAVHGEGHQHNIVEDIAQQVNVVQNIPA